MKKFFAAMVVGIFLVTGGMAWAQERASAAQAKLWVEKAEQFIKEKGQEKAIVEFNNPKGQFIKGDLYIIVYDFNGVMLAHPFIPEGVGKNRINMPDEDGKYFRREVIELCKAKGSGWVDYKFKHPQTKKIEQKTSYVKKVGDIILYAGAYK